MKVNYSGVFHYKMGHFASKESTFFCGLDIVEYANEVRCVVLTERSENNALSITNVCDRIASQIYADHLSGVSENKIVWLEHYPAIRGNKAHIDLVQFDFEVVPSEGTGPGTSGTLRFYHPRWYRLYEARHLDRIEFLGKHANLIQNLYRAQVIFEIEDKDGHCWRLVTGKEKLFVITSNLEAGIPDEGFDAKGMSELLGRKKKFFGDQVDIEQRFVDELVKGFLNKGL
ncbi:MAG TPA: hypothetical protein VMB78_00315 [Dissulfurispiraceae bacterium]|nr:hypothetical protein [Dissulfurispiraceae bacterium]